MKDYEIYRQDKYVGIANIYWDNVNDNIKNTLIEKGYGKTYQIIKLDDIGEVYELTYIINNVDDLYDIVKKYKTTDKSIFEEIDKIKEYNNIKHVKNNQTIKILIPSSYLKYFNKTKYDVDNNSLISSKIYFINQVILKDNNSELKNELDKIINKFKTITSSVEYEFYEEHEKNNLFKEALNSLNDLIDKIEQTTNYEYNVDFKQAIKII